MNDRWSRSKQSDAFVVAVNHELHRRVGTHDSKSDPLQRVDLRMSAMLELAKHNSPNGCFLGTMRNHWLLIDGSMQVLALLCSPNGEHHLMTRNK
jgi:hypothetical protein